MHTMCNTVSSLRHFVRLFPSCKTSRAEIFASPRTIPEFVITASGHFFDAAFFNRVKSSGDILTLTWIVRFMASCIGVLQLPSNVTISTLRIRAICMFAVLSVPAYRSKTIAHYVQ